jgi:hypothetical protein
VRLTEQVIVSFSDFDPNNANQMAPGNYVVVDSDNREASPLLPKNTPITLDYVSNCLNSKYSAFILCGLLPVSVSELSFSVSIII